MEANTVEKMVINHEELIKGDILPRLEIVEKAQADFTQQVETIKASQTSLELTVMKDGQQTRDLLTRFVDHFFKTDEQMIKTKEKVTLRKLGTKEKVLLALIGALVGSGGVLMSIAAILQIFFRR